MPGLKTLLLMLAASAAGAANADNIVVAEFRADEQVFPDRPYTGADHDLYRPDDLYSEELSGSREHEWSVGQFTVSGIMDWQHRANYRAGEPYSDEQFFSLGSKLLVGDNSETYLYYGYGRDRLRAGSDLYAGFGDAETTRTGLSQTLYFADRHARVGVGYEYATGDWEELYEGLQGHEINVSGQVRIGWGINAHLEAGYGLYSYNEYDGAQGDLHSARTNMRAGISRSFTPSLSWGLHYSYIDEDFDLSDLSQRRQTWGLNLEYRY